jgi:hypothetical protein
VRQVQQAAAEASIKHVGELHRVEDERDQIRLEASPSIRAPPLIYAEERCGV